MKSKLLDFDVKITQRLRIAENPGLLRRLAILFAHSGDSWFWLIGLAVVYFLGSESLKGISLWLALSILLAAGVVLVIKLVFRRKRPAGEWGAIYRKTDPHSFPSGHATRAALLATLVLGSAAVSVGAGLLMLVWALLVILARVAMGLHYFSDVLAGAGIGIVIGGIILILFPLPTIPF